MKVRSHLENSATLTLGKGSTAAEDRGVLHNDPVKRKDYNYSVGGRGIKYEYGERRE